MSYQTIQHHDASQSAEKPRLIPGLQRLSWKARITPNDAMFLGKWLSCALLITLIGTLAISGCNSKNSEENSGGHGKITQQEKGSTTSKPVHKEVGEASWYGPGFQGQETANGETFDQKDMTAAHPSLPMGTKAKVTNLENDKKVEVRINDRGPYVGGRVIDLSSAAAKKIDMKEDGTTQVKIETKAVKTKKKNSASQSSKPK
jgi:rare lipoprotein A (peptidoglycan hydrolase)